MAEVIRANISRPYLLRLALVSLFSFGLAFWCIYDGWVTYPAQRIRAIKYIELLDASLSEIRPDADNAARSLAATLSPNQWGRVRWSKEMESVLLARRNASTSEQNKYFLQLTWLYLNIPAEPTDNINDADRFRLRSTIRKTLVKIFSEPQEYSTTKNDAIARTTTRFNATWDAVCEENSWSKEYPGEPKNPYAIDQQFYMAAGIIPFSLFFLVTLLRNRGRWVEGSEVGLRNSRGDVLAFEEIEQFDKKRWDKKGIAKVHYVTGNSKKLFLLDDCNYEYQPIRTIVRLVESKIQPDQITGGDPEPSMRENEETAS